MALKIECGSFQSPVGTGNQTVTLSDATFGTVKALMLRSVTNNGNADTNGNGIMAVGFGTYRSSVVSQWCVNYFDTDAGGTSVTAGGKSSASLLHALSNATPTVDYDLALVSLGDHQFVVNWTDLPAADTTIYYFALGGDDLTDAECGVCDLTSAAGTQDVTVATGFGNPDLIFCLNSQASPAPGEGDLAGTAPISIGVGFDSANSSQSSFVAVNAAANMALGSYQNGSFFASLGSASAILFEINLAARSAWPTDGFRLTKTSAPPGDTRFGYLALKGPFSKAMIEGGCPTQPATVTQQFSLGQTPRGVFVFHNSVPPLPDSIDQASADLGTFGLGSSDGTNQAWVGVGQDDANTTSIAHRNSDNTDTVKMYSPSATGTVTSSATCAFSGTLAVLTWADTDTVLREYRGIILGDGSGVPIAWTKA